MNNEPQSLTKSSDTDGVSLPSYIGRNVMSLGGTQSLLTMNNDLVESTISGHSQNYQIVLARSELKKKIAEMRQLTKTNDIVMVQLQAMERNLKELHDSIDAKEVKADKKKKTMFKLNTTNHMLIQTLNTLELKTDMVDGFISTQTARATNKEESQLILSQNNDTYLQNLKLKESLLNLTRDHYRAADGIRHMGTGIEELRLSMQGRIE